MRHDCATRNSVFSISVKEAGCVLSPRTMCRWLLPRHANAPRIFYPGAGNPLNDVIKTKQPLHTVDLTSTQAYIKRDPPAVAAVELGGIRSNIVVPMLKDNELVGLIGIFRQEVRPFTDKQIELVQNFGRQ